MESQPDKTMVIAEIGVNHDGNAERAAELIRGSADAGADAVKFQYFDPHRLLSADAKLAAYQDGQAKDVVELLKPLALTVEALAGLRRIAGDVGVKFLATPFSIGDVPGLRQIGIDAVKIASPDAVNTPLMNAAAGLGLPMYISTGTCDLDELSDAANAVRQLGGAILQCVSAYPTPEDDAALGGIAAIAERYKVPVGYSDHTAALDSGALAVACGAVVLEKHVTHDRNAAGPDHSSSLEPGDLAKYIAAVRRAERMLGPKMKCCLELERDVRQVARQSVCVAHDLPAGHVLSADDLVIKRPGTGIPARQLDDVIGRALTQAMSADHVLQESHLAQ